jgi:hypothetical protein
VGSPADDYAFLSSTVDAKVAVGEPVAWLPHSDHMPLIVDVGQEEAAASRG